MSDITKHTYWCIAIKCNYPPEQLFSDLINQQKSVLLFGMITYLLFLHIYDLFMMYLDLSLLVCW